jgi:hypothetical protein
MPSGSRSSGGEEADLGDEPQEMVELETGAKEETGEAI